MVRYLTKVMALLAVLGAAGSAWGYSEEDWRAYSRTKVELVDSFDQAVEVAGPMTLVGKDLVFLSKDRSSLLYIDTATRAVSATRKIDCGWNLDIGAIAAHEGEVYLLSRATRQIYRYTEHMRLDNRDVFLDLGKVRFRGKPMLETFAYDGEFVYVVCLAGFSTHIARIDREMRQAYFFADAVGIPTSLCVSQGALYYTRRSGQESATFVVDKYSSHVLGGQWHATLLLTLNLSYAIRNAYAHEETVWYKQSETNRIYCLLLK